MIAAACSSIVAAIVLSGIGRPSTRNPQLVAADEASARPAWSRRQRLAAATIATIVAALIVGPLLTAGVATAAAAWPRLSRLVAARSRQRQIDAALPDAIEMLILVVHAGMTPHQGVVMLETRAPAPIRPAFAEVHRRTTRGATLADAFQALPDQLGAGAAAIADTLAMSERYGTPIGQALEQLSLDVRDRRRRHAEGEARKLPVRMSFPLVVCTLPSFVLIAIVPAVLAALSSLDTTGF